MSLCELLSEGETEISLLSSPDKSVFICKLFSEKECLDIIRETEKIGYRRNNHGEHLIIIHDDPLLAKKIWYRLQKLLPDDLTLVWKNDETVSYMRQVGLNDRFRFGKYPPGKRFNRYIDGYYIDGCKYSMLTVIIYLNNNEAATRIYSGDQEGGYSDIIPIVGKAIIFQQSPMDNIEYGELEVEEGVKYIMKMDVMFEKVAL